jgi:Asp-tRNA(Asn)/Glu-tRNA(Gln) amidotransferase A subunit family amidase
MYLVACGRNKAVAAELIPAPVTGIARDAPDKVKMPAWDVIGPPVNITDKPDGGAPIGTDAIGADAIGMVLNLGYTNTYIT